MNKLSLVLDYWKRLGTAIGNFVSVVVLTIFYFSIFALFALPFRFFSNILSKKEESSNFVLRDKNFDNLEDFVKEA